MRTTAGRGTVAAAVAVLLLLLWMAPSCGRKAKPEPKWGRSGPTVPVSLARIASAPGNAAR